MINKILLMVVLLGLTSWAKKSSIAVLPFEARGGLDRSVVTAIQERFESELINTQEASVLERSQMQAILKEQGFQNSGLCNQDNCDIEMGKLLGVEYLVKGSVSRVGDIISMNLKKIDVSTGVLVDSKAVDVDGGVEKVLTESCLKLANYFVSTGKPEGPISEVESSSNTLWWIAGGGVVALVSLGSLLFLNSNPEKESNKQTIKISGHSALNN
jgi:TolB-like protein